MSEFQPNQPTEDEAQSMRMKNMESIAEWAGISQPTRAASNAEALLFASPETPKESLKLEPTRNNEGLARAMWLLNTYKLSIHEDGLFYSPSDLEPRDDWELSKADKILAKVKLGDWRPDNRRPISYRSEDPLVTYLDYVRSVDLLNAEEEVELSMNIEAGLYAVQKLEGGKANRGEKLTEAERKELAEMALVGKDSFDRMYEANLAYVVSLARKYPNDGMPLVDRIQEGNIGLRHAVEKFDYTKGYKFSSYATNWIKQAIESRLGEQSRTIAVSEYMRQKLRRIQRYQDEMAQKGIGNVSVEEISKATKIEIDDVVALLDNHFRSPVSFDESPTFNRNGHSEENGYTLMDYICNDKNFLESCIEDESVEACMRREIVEVMRNAIVEEAEKIQQNAMKKGSKMDGVSAAIDLYGINGATQMSQVDVVKKYKVGKSPLQRFESKLRAAIKAREDVKELAQEIGL